MIARALAFALLLQPVQALAQAAPVQAEKPLQQGFTEAVITTADASKWIAFLTKDAGWEVRSRAAIGPEGALWGVRKGKTVLLANKGENTGFIRLVEIEGVVQEFIRTDDRPWDIGGIFDLNVRVKHLETLRKRMLASGWQGDSPPIQYKFTKFEVVEWIARGPDGVRIAVIERLSPPLEGWPHLKSISRVFNSTTIVRDMAKSRAFYEQVLGMKPYLLSKEASSVPGANVLGLPHNLTTTIPRDVAILHPEGKNEGSVELVQFVGADGDDFTAKAQPRNYGLSTLRFPVANLDASIRALTARGVTNIAPPVEARLIPYGKVRITGFFSPDGVWLELYEKGK